ncbi:Aldose 1-epimerase, putative [Angomonas deanei]|uniref:glucose-6-phosphate 1-epimerase n=1 Tax=Angomonas deanei TaxID=59799 RepID=A0A7G2C565_9TRYP|nr:Aldose 1-epimerase, putative [Angomonas deanei]
MAYTQDQHKRNCVTVNHSDGSAITVYEQGAHLTSWSVPTPTGLREVLYLSSTAVYKEGVALRGGVPLIFPQFGNRGPMSPSHGFARVRPWKIESIAEGEATFSLRATLQEMSPEGLVVSDSDRNAVQLYYTITFCKNKLRLGMRIVNMTSDAPLPFHFAFHSYFGVKEISNTIINGLNSTSYINNLTADPKTVVLNPPQEVRIISEEFDRIYKDQPSAIELVDATTSKRIVNIASTTLKDVVVWNPWIEKAKRFADMPDEDYHKFVCVEHGSILQNDVLLPNGEWKAEQEIEL